MSKPVKSISIPHGLPTAIAALPLGERRAYVLLWKLKSLHQGGVIWEFQKRIPTLADQFGISERTMRQQVRFLKEKGFVWYEDHRLCLASAKKIAIANISSVKAYYSVAVSEISGLEYLFETLAIQEGLKQQEHVLDELITQQLVGEKVGISNPQEKRYSDPQESQRKPKWLTKEKIEDEKRKELSRYLYEQQSLNQAKPHIKINPRVTYSRAGIAHLFGHDSKMSGSRTIRKLSRLGLVKDTPTEVIVRRHISLEDWFRMDLRKTLAYGYNLRYRSGTIYRVLANDIQLTFNPYDLITGHFNHE